MLVLPIVIHHWPSITRDMLKLCINNDGLKNNNKLLISIIPPLLTDKP